MSVETESALGYDPALGTCKATFHCRGYRGLVQNSTLLSFRLDECITNQSILCWTPPLQAGSQLDQATPVSHQSAVPIP